VPTFRSRPPKTAQAGRPLAHIWHTDPALFPLAGLLSDSTRTIASMSANGSSNLVASHPQNTHAARHGLYSDRVLAPRIEAYRDQLLALPHVAPVDEAAVDECARLLARIEAVDADLDQRGHFRQGWREIVARPPGKAVAGATGMAGCSGRSAFGESRLDREAHAGDAERRDPHASSGA
jgi:hypothetical protein